jgi:hypothetical protein
MSETSQVTFTYKEITESLIKRRDIHEGLWAIYFEFALGTGNVAGPAKDTLVPAAVLPVLRIGIQKVDKPNPLTVDAAVVNPNTEREATQVSEAKAHII